MRQWRVYPREGGPARRPGARAHRRSRRRRADAGDVPGPRRDGPRKVRGTLRAGARAALGRALEDHRAHGPRGKEPEELSTVLVEKVQCFTVPVEKYTALQWF